PPARAATSSTRGLLFVAPPADTSAEGSTHPPSMRPPGRRTPGLSEWERLGLLRAGLGLAMAAYALTYRAPESHPAPGSLRPLALALALVPVMGGAASLARSRWEPRRVAMGALLGDALAVLPTLALYAFDPRRVVVTFVLVVQ